MPFLGKQRNRSFVSFNNMHLLLSANGNTPHAIISIAWARTMKAPKAQHESRLCAQSRNRILAAP
jgi:hypothetical protein